MELVGWHPVVVREHGAGDGEVDAERDTRCHDLRSQGLGEPLPAGRATSRISVTTITVLEKRPL
jgi:hypothetical protein